MFCIIQLKTLNINIAGTLNKRQHGKWQMELIDNINKTLKNDWAMELRSGGKVAIAASCFSIYAFEELKAQLKDVDELRFIFTSPTFVTEKADKQKRESTFLV